MIKPERLHPGDTVATISPSWGCAGTGRVRWQYKLGVERLKQLGLNVVAAPNSMKGTAYLESHPEARATDLMWAFENKNVKAIIANIGGNDSVRLLPYLDPEVIRNNPKILCGYSDVMTLHLYCYKAGLSTFYGDNLLTTVGEAQGWHPYSRYWFHKTLFDSSPIGEIPPSENWSHGRNHHTDPNYTREYIRNDGYMRIQGSGRVTGHLFGGHGGMSEYPESCGITLNKSDFEGAIFFYEDIPEIWSEEYADFFFDWLGKNGFLQAMSGIIIGRMRSPVPFEPYCDIIRRIVSDKYGLPNLPIMYGLNFGHASPICVLPYGAQAELDVDELRFEIKESGVK
ncbi:MAG: LD-carboxypeptidase [Oscillospiraceae bacterium]|nr:LD-carboxypeptidase [Oscillospiraceae bacterium]